MKNKNLIITTVFALFFSLSSFAEFTIAQETKESHKCCAPHGISYCDISSGHYVCNDGGYSECICRPTAPVTTYAPLELGCCLWHGGIAASSMGQVICNDGSLSEVCSIQSVENTMG